MGIPRADRNPLWLREVAESHDETGRAKGQRPDLAGRSLGFLLRTHSEERVGALGGERQRQVCPL